MLVCRGLSLRSRVVLSAGGTGTISQMRDRWPMATTSERRTTDERVEFKSTRGISRGHSLSASSLRSFVRSMPLTKVLLGSVFHFGFLPRGKEGRGLEMLYLNEPTHPLLLPPPSSSCRFRLRRFPQTVQQK